MSVPSADILRSAGLRTGGGKARASPLPMPAAVAASVLGATFIVVGILWDISWHRSIGRDTFWTPAHMAIYFGGLLAGAAAGALVLRATFGAGSERDSSVTIGPFRGPLGAFVMIWGAVAMLASAPFDDWWHNAYGLDVRVLSPPHAVLAVGMVAVVTGALVLAVSVRNRSEGSRGWEALAAYASGVLLTLASVFVIEYTFPLHQHGAPFYEVTAFVFPFFLVRAAYTSGAAGQRYAATATALVYMAIFCAMNWILPLFPAQPRLAPIYNPITRMVPFCFPLLLVAPALVIDAVLEGRKAKGEVRTAVRDAVLAVGLGAAFFAAFIAVQWPFASFQMTPAARNWFFGGDRYWSYYFHPDAPWRYGFDPAALRLTPLAALVSIALAALSSGLGLLAGARLARVVR